MKYKAPRMVAIFFMTSFNRDKGGGHGPMVPPPPGSAADRVKFELQSFLYIIQSTNLPPTYFELTAPNPYFYSNRRNKKQ